MFYEVEGVKEDRKDRKVREVREVREVKEISFTKFTKFSKFSFPTPQPNLASEECRVQHSAKMAAMDST